MKNREWTAEEAARRQSGHPGSFYNKEDKNLFVKERTGTAFTLNLENPLS